VRFDSYCAVDISAANVTALRTAFPDNTYVFINADVESVKLGSEFDAVISSLTFKHLYPTFEEALRNIALYVRPGGMFAFDLREGRSQLFEHTDRVTYIRCYQRSEVQQILGRVGLQLVGFDTVVHDPTHRRLLVIARKPLLSSGIVGSKL
jgi:SAM-dependent methyltransferase